MMRLGLLALCLIALCFTGHGQSINKKLLPGKWRMVKLSMGAYQMDVKDTAITLESLFIMRRQQAAKPFTAQDSADIIRDGLIMMEGLKTSYMQFSKKGTFSYLLATQQDGNKLETGNYAWAGANILSTTENKLTTNFTVEKLDKQELVITQSGENENEPGLRIVFKR